VVAIADIDTRKLTRLLREKGAQAGCIMTGDAIDENAAVRAAKKFPGLKGMDLAKAVSTKRSTSGTRASSGSRPHGRRGRRAACTSSPMTSGSSATFLRILAEHGCRMTVVPAQTSADQALAMNPDGIFLSNGPGDPEPCDYAINAIARFLTTDIPVFGICLGHQLLGLASGAKTVKMKFGHHGANHPVLGARLGPRAHLQPESRLRGR
jgi:carbamoyl-phosphate synthase small subunit